MNDVMHYPKLQRKYPLAEEYARLNSHQLCCFHVGWECELEEILFS